MHTYVKVTAGNLFPVLQEFIQEAKAHRERLLVWGKNHPEVESVRGDAVKFVKDHRPSKAWRRKSEGIYLPNKRNAEGKRMAAELHDVGPKPGGMDLLLKMMRVARCKDIMMVNKTGTPGMHERGDAFYLSIDDAWLPKDQTGIEEITSSAYQKIAEGY